MVVWRHTFHDGQQPEGDIRQVHDPSIIKDGDKYYLFSTRAGIAIRCSKDLIHWRLCGDVFAHLPEWAVKDVPGLRGLWAPDVSYFNGKYHLYYSASTFGSNRSSIGLATNQTLDPSSDKYRWVDQGKVISSDSGDDWNAIDPDVVLDEQNQPWLSFGSFWGGIKLRKLEQATGKLSAQRSNSILSGEPTSRPSCQAQLKPLSSFAETATTTFSFLSTFVVVEKTAPITFVLAARAASLDHM